MINIPLSRRVADLQESATLGLNARVKELAAAGHTVYNLTAGELDGPTPRFIHAAVAKQLEQNKYTPVSGRPDLRAAIAEYESRRLGIKVLPRNVVVTAGAKSGLYGLLQVLLNPGDEVVLPIPAWVSYAHMIELAGGKVVKAPIKSNNDLDAEVIATKITAKTRAIIINSPNNPTGAIFSDKAVRELCRIANGRNLMVISDEIYSTLSYDRPFKPMSRLGFQPDQLAVINGVSKSQALTGWRLGYVVLPERLAVALNNFQSHAMGNAPLPSQLAAEAAFKRGNQPTMFRILERRRQLVTKELQKIPQIRFTQPRGAFYFWLDIRGLSKDSLDWCEKLLERTGVALVPGEAFLAPGFVRLSFAADDKILRQAIREIGQFAKGT
jgi:aspartate aminotransferase